MTRIINYLKKRTGNRHAFSGIAGRYHYRSSLLRFKKSRFGHGSGSTKHP